jgi:DNA-binding CsgD family transcriptional regulator
MTETEILYSNIADRNATIYRLTDEGKSVQGIAGALKISVSIVNNFLGDDGMGEN